MSDSTPTINNSTSRRATFGCTQDRITTATWRDFSPTGKRRCRVGILVSAHQRGRLAVLDDPRDLGKPQPPVERLRDQANPRAGKIDLQILDPVFRQDRNAITFAEPRPEQRVGELDNPEVQFPVGHAPPARHIDQRLATGREARRFGWNETDVHKLVRARLSRSPLGLEFH